jgi:hypothetical protein
MLRANKLLDECYKGVVTYRYPFAGDGSQDSLPAKGRKR